MESVLESSSRLGIDLVFIFSLRSVSMPLDVKKSFSSYGTDAAESPQFYRIRLT